MTAFAEQVEENKKILAGLQSNLQTTILNNLLSLVLGSDANQDFVVSEEEANELIRRIDNMSGVHVKADKFKTAIVGKEVAAIMDIIRNLLQNDDLPEEQRIFEIRASQK